MGIPVAAGAQSISFSGTSSFASAEFEKDGLGQTEALAGAPQATVDLFDANYGGITTGNTISRANFEATMSAAHGGGYGGVYSLDTADAQGDYTEIVFQTGGGSVSMTPGDNNYVEVDQAGGYRGKETDNFDGTGPSPYSNEFNDVRPAPFAIGTSGSKDYVGDSFLGGTTSFDLDFDPADEVSVFGFGFLNYKNFQSYQRGNSAYPNIHVLATWTDGTDTVEQMAVQFSQQDAGGDVYFGFQQPDSGYFLDGLAFYAIGNSRFAWVGADEIGLAVGDGVAVPEPGSAALTVGALVLAGVLFQRHRARRA